MNVFEKAHELGAMIAESAEFKKVNEAREAQSADNDAALVLMNYNRKRDQLIKEASDPEISNERMQEIRNEMEREVDKLNNNKTIADFMEAMQAFNDNGLGRVIKYKAFPEKKDLHKGPCFAHASILTYAYTYKKTGGYTVSARTARTQDYDLWFKFFAKGFNGANLEEPLYFYREDDKAYLRRKAKLYLWAVVTRFKGFKLLKFPIHYYIYTLTPIIGLINNEFRKFKARLKRH